MSAGSLSLTVTSPVQTFAEPISLAEVRTALRLPQVDPSNWEEDLMLERYISAARDLGEEKLDIDLVRKQQDMPLSCFYCNAIELPRGPLVSVDLIRYRNSDGVYTTLTEGTDFIVDLHDKPGVVMPPYGGTWPSFTPWPNLGAILIRYTVGYLPTDAFWNQHGAKIKTGMLYLISGWFSNTLPYVEGAQVAEYPFTASALLYSNPRIG